MKNKPDTPLYLLKTFLFSCSTTLFMDILLVWIISPIFKHIESIFTDVIKMDLLSINSMKMIGL